MAKGRPARRTAKSGQSAGRTAAGLLGLAAVVAGGAYLFEHTRSLPGGDGRSSPGALVHAPAEIQPTVGQPARPARQAAAAAQGIKPPGASPHPADAKLAPFGISEEVFEAGARAYAQQRCAGCHGRPGKEPASHAAAEQFWSRKEMATQSLRSRSAGEIYQAIARGNPAAGMPSYGPQLADTTLWDLALLLKSSGEDLPDPVLRILRSGG